MLSSGTLFSLKLYPSTQTLPPVFAFQDLCTDQRFVFNWIPTAVETRCSTRFAVQPGSLFILEFHIWQKIKTEEFSTLILTSSKFPPPRPKGFPQKFHCDTDKSSYATRVSPKSQHLLIRTIFLFSDLHTDTNFAFEDYSLILILFEDLKNHFISDHKILLQNLHDFGFFVFTNVFWFFSNPKMQIFVFRSFRIFKDLIQTVWTHFISKDLTYYYHSLLFSFSFIFCFTSE